jgi:chromate transporter
MARSLGRSGVRGAIAALALLTTLRVASPLAQPLVIAAGALIGTLMLRIGGDARAMDRRNGNDRSASNGLLLVLSVPLLGLILTVAASHWPDRATTLAAAFYRAGALVFGGGHVVLPLLREAVVTPGWLSPATFLTGYALAQLVPGPLFTLAANLGTACGTSGAAPALGMLALLALFLPGWLLVAGALPWWSNLQQWPWARGAVSGAGAAVVGVLTAALLGPVAHEALHDATDLVCAFIAFGLLIPGRLPMPLVVLATTVACGWMSR